MPPPRSSRERHARTAPILPIRRHTMNRRPGVVPCPDHTPFGILLQTRQTRKQASQRAGPKWHNGRGYEVQPTGGLPMLTVGLDVPLRKSSWCVLGENGRKIRQQEVKGHWPEAVAGASGVTSRTVTNCSAGRQRPCRTARAKGVPEPITQRPACPAAPLFPPHATPPTYRLQAAETSDCPQPVPTRLTSRPQRAGLLHASCNIRRPLPAAFRTALGRCTQVVAAGRAEATREAAPRAPAPERRRRVGQQRRGQY